MLRLCIFVFWCGNLLTLNVLVQAKEIVAEHVSNDLLLKCSEVNSNCISRTLRVLTPASNSLTLTRLTVANVNAQTNRQYPRSWNLNDALNSWGSRTRRHMPKYPVTDSSPQNSPLDASSVAKTVSSSDSEKNEDRLDPDSLSVPAPDSESNSMPRMKMITIVNGDLDELPRIQKAKIIKIKPKPATMTITSTTTTTPATTTTTPTIKLTTKRTPLVFDTDDDNTDDGEGSLFVEETTTKRPKINRKETKTKIKTTTTVEIVEDKPLDKVIMNKKLKQVVKTNQVVSSETMFENEDIGEPVTDSSIEDIKTASTATSSVKAAHGHGSKSKTKPKDTVMNANSSSSNSSDTTSVRAEAQLELDDASVAVDISHNETHSSTVDSKTNANETQILSLADSEPKVIAEKANEQQKILTLNLATGDFDLITSNPETILIITDANNVTSFYSLQESISNSTVNSQ